MSLPFSNAQALTLQFSTRNQHRTALANLAQVTDLQACVRITQVAALQLFVTLASFNPGLGIFIQDLGIGLPMRTGYPGQLVRECLRLTPNLVSLRLELPSAPPTILYGVIFPRLTIMITNLPHATVRMFLSFHPLVTSLTLAACGARTRCPLQGFDLSRVTELQCPARCFTGIATGQITTATINLTRTTSMAALALQSLSTCALTTLTIEFFANDHDILQRVAAVAPRVRKLRLIEMPSLQRRPNNARRPWNDLREWHFTLMRLPFLEVFMLRALLRISSQQRPEESIVTSWANGIGRRARRHPNLHHISLLQQNGVGGMQSLSHWFKAQGTWECTLATLVNSNHSFTA